MSQGQLGTVTATDHRIHLAQGFNPVWLELHRPAASPRGREDRCGERAPPERHRTFVDRIVITPGYRARNRRAVALLLYVLAIECLFT